MQAVTLAILAGGKGERMGGAKSRLRIGSVAILEFLMKRFNWKGPTLLVSGIGNENPAGREWFDREVTDAVAGEGPLRGVLTALEVATTPLVAFATVDMVGVGREMVEHLVVAVSDDDNVAKGAMFFRLSPRRGCVEPFPCVLRRDLVSVVRERIARGQRSVRRLLEEGVKEIPPKAEWGEAVWRNLNTPGDLEGFNL